MVDLVIRPTVGAGNKIIIQDQAGQPVLTTKDSGATLVGITGTLSEIPAGTSGNLLTSDGVATGTSGARKKCAHGNKPNGDFGVLYRI